MTIYSSEYSRDKSGKHTEKTSELEYGLASIKSGSCNKHHHATATISEQKFNAQSEIAKNKNNKEFLAKLNSNRSKTVSTKPVIGSAAWALMKNTI